MTRLRVCARVVVCPRAGVRTHSMLGDFCLLLARRWQRAPDSCDDGKWSWRRFEAYIRKTVAEADRHALVRAQEVKSFYEPAAAKARFESFGAAWPRR